MWSIENKITAGFGLALVLLGFIGVGAYRSTKMLAGTAGRVTHAGAVLDQLEAARARLREAEAGQRGYLLFNEPRHLTRHRAAAVALADTLQTLREVTTGKERQQERLAALARLIELRTRLLEQGIALRERRGFKAALQHVLTGRGRAVSDEFGTLIGEMEREETRLLDRLAERAAREAESTAAVIAAACLIAVTFIAVAVMTIRRDLGERERVEAVLRASEERMRLLIDTAHDAFVAADADGRITEWNRQAETIFGWLRDEALGRAVAETIIPPRFREAHRRGLERFLATGESQLLNRPISLHALRRDGREFPVELTVVPIRSGATCLFSAFVRDVSERDEAEEARSRLVAIVEASDDAIISETLEGIVVSWNAGAERIYGYRAAEVVGRSIGLLIPPDRAGELDHILVTIARGESLEHYETVRVRNDGRRLDVSLTVSPIRSASGAVTGASVIGRDITERKRLDERLRRLNVELERRVEERTAELRRSNEELQRFAYVASHDLQEPLRMVSSYTQLLAQRYRDKLDADAEEFINYAVEGAANMQRLICDLLSFSQVTTRAQPLAEVRVEAVLEQVLDNLRLTIDESGAVVTHGPLPSVVADATQLGQVFQNLIANAVKFRGPSPARVHVSAQRYDGGWTFAVQDNGIGIAPEYRDRVFVVFQRLHGRGQYPGTGIGLAICKKIVERHGGRIWVESTPGEGSTFSFSIPAQAVAGRDAEHAGAA